MCFSQNNMNIIPSFYWRETRRSTATSRKCEDAVNHFFLYFTNSVLETVSYHRSTTVYESAFVSWDSGFIAYTDSMNSNSFASWDYLNMYKPGKIRYTARRLSWQTPHRHVWKLAMEEKLHDRSHDIPATAHSITAAVGKSLIPTEHDRIPTTTSIM